MSRNAPDIAFLGICDRVTAVQYGHHIIWEYDILGLKHVVMSNLFPIPLQYFYFVFAFYKPAEFEPARVKILRPDGKELLYFGFEFASNPPLNEPKSPRDSDIPSPGLSPFWSVIPAKLEKAPIVDEPGEYRLVLCRGNDELTIGYLYFHFVPAAPLSEDRIAAIKSHPLASKSVRVSYKCDNCGTEIRVYAGLERSDKAEREGWIWYKELPDRFECSCGGFHFNLNIMRDNLHSLLGRSTNTGGISFTRLYEKRALESVCSNFKALLDQNTLEGPVQKFIEDNPILLHQFSPERIFYKAPILTKHETDIVILTPKKELLLIEIEKPGARLMDKRGGVSAKMQQPLKQVRDWIHELDEHRAAALDCIGLTPQEVGSIRGIVILGRDKPYDELHLRKLKAVDFGRITFLTYDDLLASLVNLTKSLEDI